MLDIERIRAAHRRITKEVVITPLLIHDRAHAGASTLYLKAENLQRTGSFKFRGAFNTLSQLDPNQRAAGVVACSSGNHAQGVALAGNLLNIQTTIVMPADAPRAKIERTRRLGAEVVEYDRSTESREDIARSISQECGAEIVWPYDDYRVMAGQGTAALEMIEQLGDAILDSVLVPASGGGLAAGVSTVFKSLSPTTLIVTVEPEGFDDHARSFVAGEIHSNEQRSGSICDALLAVEPGALTFPLNRANGCTGVSVSEMAVLQAMRWAFEELKLVLEPGGAIALAAALTQSQDLGSHVGVILSGGNVDAALFRRALDS